MRHVRSLCFESLEDRKLLSRAHLVTHAKPAATAAPLVLNGTLNVDNKALTTSMDDQGDVMTSIPVAGQLGTIGKVHGVWNEMSDQFGDYMGPDTVQLHTAKGSFVVAFSEQNTDAIHHLAGGVTESIHPEITSDGTGAYARERGTGTITLTSNSGSTVVKTMEFSS